MPAAAKPGDRVAMEAALSTEQFRALRDTCRAFGIPPDRWHLVPGIARERETLAVSRLAESLQTDRGLAWKAAVSEAAIVLGLEPDTMLSRLRRWHGEAFRRAA